MKHFIIIRNGITKKIYSKVILEILNSVEVFDIGMVIHTEGNFDPIRLVQVKDNSTYWRFYRHVGKKLKPKHKEIIRREGHNPRNFLYVKDTFESVEFVHRDTGDLLTIRYERK